MVHLLAKIVLGVCKQITLLILQEVIQTSQLMLYREIMAVCSEIHTKHINTAVWVERRVVNVKLAVHIVTTVRYI